MKKIILIACFFPLTNYAQDNLKDNSKDSLNYAVATEEVVDCQFKYTLQLKKYSGLFMCPYLGPKMITELNKIDACNIKKDEEDLNVTFKLDSLYLEEDIQYIFLKVIGIPEWAIINIKILANEK
tara:strand:+ start:268 stop:642 length:375 start_codon:yes stop_codon:yes gene_type:complete